MVESLPSLKNLKGKLPAYGRLLSAMPTKLALTLLKQAPGGEIAVDALEKVANYLENTETDKTVAELRQDIDDAFHGLDERVIIVLMISIDCRRQKSVKYANLSKLMPTSPIQRT